MQIFRCLSRQFGAGLLLSLSSTVWAQAAFDTDGATNKIDAAVGTLLEVIFLNDKAVLKELEEPIAKLTKVLTLLEPQNPNGPTFTKEEAARRINEATGVLKHVIFSHDQATLTHLDASLTELDKVLALRQPVNPNGHIDAQANDLLTLLDASPKDAELTPKLVVLRSRLLEKSNPSFDGVKQDVDQFKLLMARWRAYLLGDTDTRNAVKGLHDRASELLRDHDKKRESKRRIDDMRDTAQTAWFKEYAKENADGIRDLISKLQTAAPKPAAAPLINVVEATFGDLDKRVSSTRRCLAQRKLRAECQRREECQVPAAADLCATGNPVPFAADGVAQLRVRYSCETTKSTSVWQGFEAGTANARGQVQTVVLQPGERLACTPYTVGRP